MATISPYGDSRAHGSMGKALTFRRFRGRTRLSKHYNPSTKHTPGQLTQRDKFSAAIYSLNRLNDQWKKFLYDRGVSTGQHGPNLYVSAHIKNRLPSSTPGIPMDALTNIVLFNPAGLIGQSLKITIGDLLDTYGCTLWNKTEGIVEGEIPSEIGPNAVSPVAPTFHPVKFNNGVLLDANSESLGFTPFTLGNAGIIAFYFKPNGWSITNGWGPENGNHAMFAWSHPSVYNFTHCYYGWDVGTWYWFNGSHYVIFDFSGANHDVADGELCHMAFAWNRDGIDGPNTMEIYKNGILVDSSTEALDDMTLQNSNILNVGNMWNGLQYCQAYLDNVKVYPGTSRLPDILANYQQEAFPGWDPLGYIYDSENIFTPTVPTVPGPAKKISIQNVTGDPEKIPFDYPLTLHWFRDPDQEGTARILLPRLDIPAETGITLYIATDGSVYWDEAMTQIACTPRMYYAKTE